ncbi:hypothetical protein V8C35DRAFT_291425 [Trichoderma chlorosporum]
MKETSVFFKEKANSTRKKPRNDEPPMSEVSQFFAFMTQNSQDADIPISETKCRKCYEGGWICRRHNEEESCVICTKVGKPCVNDLTGAQTPSEKRKEKISQRIQSKAIQENDFSPSTTKCRTCFQQGKVCRRSEKEEKCLNCLTRNLQCSNDLTGAQSRAQKRREKREELVPERIEPATRKCDHCICDRQPCTRKSTLADCDRCIKKGWACKTKEREPRKETLEIPKEDRCSPCITYNRTGCDGKVPCNRCIKKGTEKSCVQA